MASFSSHVALLVTLFMAAWMSAQAHRDGRLLAVTNETAVAPGPNPLPISELPTLIVCSGVQPITPGRCYSVLNTCQNSANNLTYCCATKCANGTLAPFCAGDVAPGFQSFEAPTTVPPSPSGAPAATAAPVPPNPPGLPTAAPVPANVNSSVTVASQSSPNATAASAFGNGTLSPTNSSLKVQYQPTDNTATRVAKPLVFLSKAVVNGVDQGVCGDGAAADFPTRCYFNNDPQGRYVCCDTQGCNGFNPPDFLFPHCQNFGFVPPGYGVGAAPLPPPGQTPPPTPTPPTPNPPPVTGPQGVCGTGDAAPFPIRCYFNSDPQGRYVCCDSQGCNGFNPPDFLFPHCQNFGFVPPGFGVGATPGPVPTPPPTGPPLPPINTGFFSLIAQLGFSPMHGTPVPFANKVFMLDRTDPGPSRFTLPNGSFAYAGEFDLDTNTIRAVNLPSNTWCSAGAYLPDGVTILNNGGGDGSGGFAANAGIRTFLDGGDLNLVATSIVIRWYPSAQILPDGRIMLLGGQDISGIENYANQASWEYYPSDGNTYPLQLLVTARGVNLYPFMHLLPDGRMFIFAGVSSIILDYNAKTVNNLPDLPGNARQYPQSGSSVLLPMDYRSGFVARVFICGGGNMGDATTPASTSCGTIDLSSTNPSWVISASPTPRVMGQMVYLLDGSVLYINGGLTGYASYMSSSLPNFTPDIFSPFTGTWSTVTASTTIARLYHSVAILILDGRVLIHGSNPRGDYNFDDPTGNKTQTALETFSPWYIGNPNRPTIVTLQTSVPLNGRFTLTGAIPGGGAIDPSLALVALVQPSFATHAVSMGQRYVLPQIVAVNGNVITVQIPPSGNVVPPGPYFCTFLYGGVPSPAQWIKVTLA